MSTNGRTDQDTPTVDDQFRSLMEGLRTSLPGVQVLFAFLLTAPLQGGFADLGDDERVVFAVAFYASGLASLLLIAPSVHQRMRAPASGLQRKSPRHLIWATWLGIAGSISMIVAIVATVYLVSSVVFGSVAAAIAAAAIAGVATWSWCYLPLVTFRRDVDGPQD